MKTVVVVAVMSRHQGHMAPMTKYACRKSQ